MQTENTYVETDLGNIAFNPRGEYSDETSYEYLDTVSYKGGSYVCLAELAKTTSGIAPEPGKNTEHWQMLALPGGLTSDYIAMHDDVVNKAKQVETSRTAVELSQQEVEAAQADVSQMWQDTQDASEEAIASRDSAAGYAQSAEASRTAAKESEDNVNVLATTFDSHVNKKISEAEKEINNTKQNAVDAVSESLNAAVTKIENETNKQVKSVENAGASQVSAVNKAGKSRVDEISTAGSTVIGAVNTTGSTQVSTIETKGADQVKAIQEAGENALQNISDGVDKGLSEEGKAADAKATGEAISKLTEDLAYKINSRLTPIQFETVLGYYGANGFVTGKKEWGARLMRVQCKKGDKYLYHGYCDNIYGVSFLDSEFRIIRQISVLKNKEFEIDVNVIDNASYIDFYSGNIGMKTYVQQGRYKQ